VIGHSGEWSWSGNPGKVRIVMPNSIEFPDGVRLARLEEIPGAGPERSAAWARVQSAGIAPGYTLTDSDDPRFAKYAEINVDASNIWALFRDLCDALLSSPASLVAGKEEADPLTLGSGDISSILAALEHHKYQLAHDGFIQFGLICDRGGAISEVFVAPTKHFKVWFNDEERFRAIMNQYALQEHNRLEFIDEYPRTFVALPKGPGVFGSPTELLNHLKAVIGAGRDPNQSS
jgi:hypothetical protein